MSGNYTTIQDIVLTVLAILIIIIFAGAIYSLFRAIFQFIFSDGKDDVIQKAIKNIRYTIMGIIVTLLLLFAFPILFKQIRVNGYQYYTAQNIFNKAGDLIRRIFSIGSEGFGDMFGAPSSSSSSSLNNDYTPSGSL